MSPLVCLHAEIVVGYMGDVRTGWVDRSILAPQIRSDTLDKRRAEGAFDDQDGGSKSRGRRSPSPRDRDRDRDRFRR